MSNIVKLSSKRQLTIPVRIFDKYFKPEELVTIEECAEGIFLRKTRDILQKLKGSVEIPTRFKSKPLKEVIAQAKSEYFKRKHS